MKINSVIRNMLLFFFLIVIFGQALIINQGTVVDELIVSLVFGLLMAFIPNILKFFKLPVNFGSLMLMGIIVSFAFFFLAIYVFNLVIVTGQTIDLGISLFPPINITDKTIALVFLSITAAIGTVILEVLDER